MDINYLLNIDFYIVLAFLYELLFRYPSFLPHPVVFMGKLISIFENLFLKNTKSKFSKKLNGAFTTFILVISTFIIFYFAESFIKNSYALFAFRLFFGISCIASGSLFYECLKVVKFLDFNFFEESKKQLAMLVTRDTSQMKESKIYETTIETLSENLSDGVIAPLFYLFIGGIPAAMAYKMASTLDSMIGYKNDKYEDFGFASAKLDDILNFIPARITALLIMISAFILSLGFKNSVKVWLAHRKNTESPNGGNPESAMAGALNIRFGGELNYFGELCFKPFIGFSDRNVGRNDVLKAIKLSLVSSLVFVAAGFSIKMILTKGV